MAKIQVKLTKQQAKELQDLRINHKAGKIVISKIEKWLIINFGTEMTEEIRKEEDKLL